MPKDAYYFKHDANASSDLKIKAMRKHYSFEGYGWYWYLIELMRSESDYRLEYCQFTFDSLSDDFKCDSEKVKTFIDDCISPKIGLFKKDGNYFYSDRLIRDMAELNKIRELRREAGRASQRKQRGLEDSQPPKKRKKHAAPRLDDVLIPTNFESELLEVLKIFKGWEYDEVEDLAWLRALTQDFQNVTVANLKACADFHSEDPRSKGPWKSRIRNWLKKDTEFGKEGKGGAHQRRPRPLISRDRYTRPED